MSIPAIPQAIFAIEVDTGNGWVRMRSRFASRESAHSWLSFVKSAWYARHARVVKVDPSFFVSPTTKTPPVSNGESPVPASPPPPPPPSQSPTADNTERGAGR